MMNHALFAGLLYAQATPITDDAFHSQTFAHKLHRAAQEPAIRQGIEDRAARLRYKAGALASTALRDAQLRLPILSPEVPLAEVLEHRHRDPEGLSRARDTLGQLARRIQTEPWSRDFEREIETEMLPDVITKLAEAARARDAWLETQSTKYWLKATGIAAGAAAAVLGVMMAPVTPVAIAVGGLGLVSGSAIPGAEWLLDWRAGKKTVQENGLHYLFTT